MYTLYEKTWPIWHVRFPHQSMYAQRTLPVGCPRTWQPFASHQQCWTDPTAPKKKGSWHNPQHGWVIHRSATQFLSQHSHWSSNESQTSVDSRLLGLPGPYHLTPRSLTDTGRGYHIENLRRATTLSPPFPSEGSTNPPNGPARSEIIHNNYQLNWRGKQALNLTSGSLHSASTITYHLRIAWANDVPPR
jgi:hypothetical protein